MAVSPTPTRRRRPPPRLRTKTGCLTCRQRRKKCNEQFPICDGCSRNRLVCSWKKRSPSEGAASLDLVPASCPPSSPPSGPSSVSLNEDISCLSIGTFCEVTLPLSPYQTFFGVQSDNESQLLHHFVNYSFPTLIGAHAHPIFKEDSLLMMSAMHVSPVKDALFAVSSLHLSNRRPEYGTQALRYYAESVHLLREQVENTDVDGFEDSLIMTVVWLYIFEIWSMRRGQSCHAGSHLKACMRILQVRKESVAFTQRCSPSPWERIVAESVLFNSATMALFDPTLASIPVPKLRDLLEPFFARPAIPDCTPLANSPVLGIPNELFFIALELSQLCYRMPLGPLDYVQALRLEERLGGFELQYLDDIDYHEEQYGVPKAHQAAKLYIIAAKVLLLKILHPNKASFDPATKDNLISAMAIIRDDIGETSCGQYFTWPVFIISCALDHSDDIGRDQIRRAVKKIWSKSSSGNVIFVLQALDTISEMISAGAGLSMPDLLRCCV